MLVTLVQWLVVGYCGVVVGVWDFYVGYCGVVVVCGLLCSG